MRGKRVIRNYDNEGNLISKECSCCHEIKLASEFYKNIKKIDGLQLKCKECNKKYDEKHYRENKDKINERQRKYYQENKDKFNEYNKKYRQKNPDYEKEYYQENKESKKEYGKEYRKKQTQEALQQIEIEIESNPEKYNYREGEKIFGVIYLVHNIKSNRYYVGQTKTTFDIRYPSGWLYYHRNKESIKEDLQLYGENSFEYTKLFKVAHSQYELDKLEAYYIDYYDSYENGYNENRGNIFTDRGKEII